LALSKPTSQVRVGDGALRLETIFKWPEHGPKHPLPDSTTRGAQTRKLSN